MKILLALVLFTTACGNYGNVYLPQGERKPFLGPDPKDFPAALAAPLAVTATASIRLNVPPGTSLRLKAAWKTGTPSTVVWRVNSRRIAETHCTAGDCTLNEVVPDGTILEGVATLIEIAPGAPLTLDRLAIER